MNNLRSLINPLVITAGIFFPQAHFLSFLLPFFVGTMMVLTFSSPVPQEQQEHGVTMKLGLRSLIGSFLLIGIAWFGVLVWGWPREALLATTLIALAPPANAAPVMAKVLGGNAILMLKIFIVGHLVACFSIPLVIGFFTQTEFGVWSGARQIFNSIQPIITIPLAFAFGVRALYPKLSDQIVRLQKHTLVFWSASVFIIISKAGHDVRELGVAELWNNGTLPWMGGVSLVLCLLLYFLGWFLERKSHPIEGAQSMGQKNTVLVIWIAQLYVGPVAALGPVFYVVWQNIILSLLLHRARQKK